MTIIILLITLVILSILNTALLILLLLVKTTQDERTTAIDTIKDTMIESMATPQPARVISPIARDLNQLNDL